MGDPAADALPVFSPADVRGRSRDTLYLLTESRAAASPLVAALTDMAMRAGRRHAELAGGRLDPPMVLILTRPPTSAASPTCRTSTATSDPAAWCRSRSCSPTSRA